MGPVVFTLRIAILNIADQTPGGIAEKDSALSGRKLPLPWGYAPFSHFLQNGSYELGVQYARNSAFNQDL